MSILSVPRLSRSALLGLTAALFLGSVFLVVRAVSIATPSCEGLSEQECALERELGSDMARLHGMLALAFVLIGSGIVFGLRRTPNPT